MGAINRDHTDHVEDVKDEQAFAGLGMDVPNDEGIVLVAVADVVPTTSQTCGICARLLLLAGCDDGRLMARPKMSDATPLGGIQAAWGRKEGFSCDTSPSIGRLDDYIHNRIYGGSPFLTLAQT